MREKILSMLSAADGYVSGQTLCEALAVSRTAVWKVINQLKEEGYEIESVPSKGYRIISRPDVVTAGEIKSRLSSAWAGQNVVSYGSIDSTNNEAKKLAEEGAAHGTLVVAEEQVQGRGRRGRTWVTPSGSAIAMSLILRPDLPPERAPMLTLVMGMAAADACRDVCNAPVSIKWPNDVIVEGKKVCGILTEMSCEVDFINYVVVGIGINTGVDEFPPDLREIAASLHTFAGHRIDRAALIDACMERFEHYYGLFCKTRDFSLLREDYQAQLAGLGENVRVLSAKEDYDGVSEGISLTGELLVRRPDGTLEQINAGEIALRWGPRAGR